MIFKMVKMNLLGGNLEAKVIAISTPISLSQENEAAEALDRFSAKMIKLEDIVQFEK